MTFPHGKLLYVSLRRLDPKQPLAPFAFQLLIQIFPSWSFLKEVEHFPKQNRLDLQERSCVRVYGETSLLDGGAGSGGTPLCSVTTTRGGGHFQETDRRFYNQRNKQKPQKQTVLAENRMRSEFKPEKHFKKKEKLLKINEWNNW